MPGVFREISIAHNGQQYSLTPSNALLRRIESEGVSILGMVAEVGKGKMPIFDIAKVASMFLIEAGVPVTEDEMYGELMTDLGQNDGAGVIAMCEVIVSAITPPGMDEKKTEPAPVAAKSKPAKRAK